MLGEADVVPPTEYQGPSASGQETKKGDVPPTSVPRPMLDLGPSEDLGVLASEGTNLMA
jgi:hypothetical protein